MIQSERVADILKKNMELMATLTGHSLVGFALIIDPEGTTIEIPMIGTEMDTGAFYKFMLDRIQEAIKRTSQGGQYVGTPGSRY